MKTEFSFAKWAGLCALFFFSFSGLAKAVSADAADFRQWDDLMNRSVRALKTNHLTEAITLCDSALAMAKTYGPTDTHLSRSQVLRAEIYLWQKENAKAEELFLAAVASCEAAVGKDHPDLVHPLTSLANFYYYIAKNDSEVAAIFERILKLVEQASNRDEHQVILWTRNLALVYQQMQNFEQAEPLFARAVAQCAKADPRWTSHEMLTQAEFYRVWKKYDRAESVAKGALGLREEALKTNAEDVDAKLDVAVALDALGLIYLGAEKVNDAEAVCRRSLDLVLTFMTPDQPDLVPRLVGLGEVMRVQKKFVEADDLYRRAIDVTEKSCGSDSREMAVMLTQRAKLLKEMGREKESAELDAKADVMLRKFAGN